VELGYSLADLARLLGMTGQGVGYAVRRGERIAKETNYKLIDCQVYTQHLESLGAENISRDNFLAFLN